MRMTLETLARTETLSDRVAMEIRLLLTKRGQSQAALARALEVAPMWVSDRLTGRVQLTIPDLARIAETLGVNVVDLIGRAEKGPEGSYVTVGSHGTAMGIFTPEIPRPRTPPEMNYPQPDLAAASFPGRVSLQRRAGQNETRPSGPRETAPTGW